MFINNIRTALYNSLKGVPSSLPTSWENVRFTPPGGAYQIVNVLFADPKDIGIGNDGYHMNLGYMQVRLMYPIGSGSFEASNMAESIRSAFKRGSSHVYGGATITISETPSVYGGQIDNGMFSLMVDVPFFSNVIN